MDSTREYRGRIGSLPSLYAEDMHHLQSGSRTVASFDSGPEPIVCCQCTPWSHTCETRVVHGISVSYGLAPIYVHLIGVLFATIIMFLEIHS